MCKNIQITVGLKLSDNGLEAVRMAAESLAAAKRSVEAAASALERLCGGGLELFELPACAKAGGSARVEVDTDRNPLIRQQDSCVSSGT